MSTLTRADTPTQSPDRRVVLARRLGQRRRVDLGQQAMVGQILDGRGVLGVDHVCRRASALRHDLVRQCVLVVAAHVDRDARRLLESGDECVCRLHVLSAVERDGRARRGGATSGEAAGRHDENGEGQACPPGPAAMPHDGPPGGVPYGGDPVGPGGRTGGRRPVRSHARMPSLDRMVRRPGSANLTQSIRYA